MWSREDFNIFFFKMKSYLSLLVLVIMLYQTGSAFEARRGVFPIGLSNDIWAALKELLPDVSVSDRFTINDVVQGIFDQIADEASSLTRLAGVYASSGSRITTLDEVQSAVRHILHTGLATGALNRGTKALQWVCVYTPFLRRDVCSRVALTFKVGYIEEVMKSRLRNTDVAPNALVFMTAILEYLTDNALELAGDVIAENKPAEETRETSSSAGHYHERGSEQSSGFKWEKEISTARST